MRTVELIVVTPDRGLTGALNTNILRRGSRFILEETPPAEGHGETRATVQVIAVGKKARDYFVRTRQDVIAEFIGIGDTTTLDAVRPIADIAIDDFASGKVDAVYVVYSRFINTLVQRPEVLQHPSGRAATSPRGLLRLHLRTDPGDRTQRPAAALRRGPALSGDPGGIASEHSARMVAMRSASDNAKEIQEELTLSTTRRVRRRSPERFPRSRLAPMQWPANAREVRREAP